MKAIWKYRPRPGDFALEMPLGARILTVQMQGVEPEMWALVDPAVPKVKHRFVTVGTEHPLPDEIETFAHVGTFQLQGGALVFHLFDAGEVP